MKMRDNGEVDTQDKLRTITVQFDQNAIMTHSKSGVKLNNTLKNTPPHYRLNDLPECRLNPSSIASVVRHRKLS